MPLEQLTRRPSASVAGAPLQDRDDYPKERKLNFGRSAKMQFILIGFTQDMGFRVFSFERMGDDRVRTKCTVKADLALIRRYGIQIQELPLLCRSLLDRCEEGREMDSLTFTEDEMRVCATERAAAREGAAKKRRPPHKPTGENVGAAWRAQQP
jgi:hypothetical protein